MNASRAVRTKSTTCCAAARSEPAVMAGAGLSLSQKVTRKVMVRNEMQTYSRPPLIEVRAITFSAPAPPSVLPR